MWIEVDTTITSTESNTVDRFAVVILEPTKVILIFL